MKFAITLRLDCATDRSLHEFRAQLSASASIHDSYSTHVTLAAFDAEVQPGDLWRGLEDFAARWSRIPITLSGLGIFPGVRPVVWAAPAANYILIKMQRELCKLLDGINVYDAFNENCWIPHVTLFTKISNFSEAIESASLKWRPIHGFLEKFDLISFPPVEVKHSMLLKM
ncbi:2'-5' RNA ligase family protein [Sphingomonas sp. R3G8C]|uniref:2'-5' RNA ligase family protein n=1 Tax=Novosphingobium rhizosphaerae TaxID=1551649 RepID=UPI001C5495F7